MINIMIQNYPESLHYSKKGNKKGCKTRIMEELKESRVLNATIYEIGGIVKIEHFQMFENFILDLFCMVS